MFWKQFGKMWNRIFEFCFPLSELDILFGLQNETCDEIIDTLNYCVLFALLSFIFIEQKRVKAKFFFEFVHILKTK